MARASIGIFFPIALIHIEPIEMLMLETIISHDILSFLLAHKTLFRVEYWTFIQVKEDEQIAYET